MEKVILTGDRPTGKLHIYHYVGSLRRRVELQNSGEYDKIFIMIADAQALTDNADNPEKIRQNVIEVALDYLSAGLDPSKCNIFVQSAVPELTELAFYYMNLVSVARVQRNPTVKTEIEMRNFEGGSIPTGFFCYPISQAADITLFHGTTIPVGEDQKPMIELTNEIVRRFNHIYGEVLNECQVLLPENKACMRLPGTDGKAKMSKSLGNCIYLSDTAKELKKKVNSMFTDPQHLNIEDPGHIEGNTVFTYLDAFCKDEDFERFLPDYKNLDEMKATTHVAVLVTAHARSSSTMSSMTVLNPSAHAARNWKATSLRSTKCCVAERRRHAKLVQRPLPRCAMPCASTTLTTRNLSQSSRNVSTNRTNKSLSGIQTITADSSFCKSCRR